MSQDTIANMLSAIKNASMVGKEFVEFPHSKGKEAILKVLKKNDCIEAVKAFKEKGSTHKGLRVTIAYEGSKSKITDIGRVSKPGRRIYKKSEEIKTVHTKYSVLVVSTPKGVMSGQDAKKKKLGGEVICKVDLRG